MMSFDCPHPVSRTYQYKKVTKPLLERKRRARINRCLDELKDLMVDALETEGEDISKLEKADILELTVRHLQRLHASRSNALSSVISKNEEVSPENRWLSGFGHCASEACSFLSTVPGETAEKLAQHLATGLQTNRQTNSPTNSSTSSIFDNFEHVANLATPCSANPTIEVPTSISPRTPTQGQSSSAEPQLGKSGDTAKDAMCLSTVKIYKEPPPNIFKMKKSRDRYSNPAKNKTNLSDATVEDDEEIDVERVDEADPMWRPW